VSWGTWGKVLFAIVAAAFLSDTWLTTLDATSRVHTDFLLTYFPSVRRHHPRSCYYAIACVLTVITLVTMHFANPAELILLSAVLGFIGTVVFTGALLLLSFRRLPRSCPLSVKPGPWGAVLLSISWTAYLVLALIYLRITFLPR
jgi:uncharacterized membrane protein YgdD (TMEM256/DUF423 family)